MVKIDLSDEPELGHELNVEHEPSDEPMLMPSTIVVTTAASTRVSRPTTEAIA